MTTTNTIAFEINNGRTLTLTQEKFDGAVTVSHVKPNGEVDMEWPYAPRKISPDQFVMLMNLYSYIMDNDVRNDFVNPYGKNKE